MNPESSSRPNILFVFSDQHRADALGCAGHPMVQTPNLDRLAAGGVRFRHAFAAAPICHPGRSAMLTGRHVHRCCDLTTPKQLVDLSLPNMGTIFRQAGYATAAFGKMHVEVEDDEHDLGFDERALRIYTPMKNDYQHTIGLEKFWQYCSYLPRYKPHPDAQPRHSYNLTNEPIQLEDELILDHMTADRAIEFLKVAGASCSGSENTGATGAGSSGHTPFFLYVGLEKPHNEMYAPKRFHDLYDPARMELPENRHFDRSRLPDAVYDNPEFPIADGLSDDQMRHATAAYYANISYMDEQAGRVLDALDELGLADNTIVVYSTDHGEHLFNHQMVHKQCFFEEAVRVPLILRLPGMAGAGTARNQFASLLDLLPTFCDACGIAPPGGLDGTSLLPTIAGNAPLRDAVFSEYYSAGIPERMIRTERWKYVHSHGDLHQLYDLENDPHENMNLIDDPAYAVIAAELDERVCRDWVLPDMSRVPRKRGDTRPGQRSHRETKA